MPRLRPGVYEVRRRNAVKGVEHSAIVDVGNRLGLLPLRDVFRPHSAVLVHQTPPELAVEYLPEGLDDEWKVVRQVNDVAGARARLRQEAVRRRYDLLMNNCEHFASAIATGQRESPQIRGVGILVGIGALIWLLGGSEN